MLYDATNYLLFTNPVSRGVGSSVWGLGKLTGLIAADPVQVARAQTIVLPSLRSLMSGRGIAYMRLGALSGAAAIGMHLYYTQRKQMELKRRDYRLEDLDADQQRIFETTNLFHFVHSVVLLSAPLMRTPVFTASMFVFGTALFAGSGYYRSLGGRRNVSALTGSGTCCLIIAWMSMLV